MTAPRPSNEPTEPSEHRAREAIAVFEEFTRQSLRGDAPSSEELLQAHPEIAGHLSALLRFQLAQTPSQLAVPFVELRPGDDFGDYKILRELGRGASGIVYLASTRDALRREVALKVLDTAFQDLRGAARFTGWNEATIAARVEHVGICPVYQHGVVGRTPFLAMRYMPGGSLRDRIRTRVDVGGLYGAVGTIESVARAAHHAHERGIVHRDISPGNILFGENDYPVLADFGQATQLGSTDANRADVGTAPYVAPERWRGDALSPSSDVFSLGATLFEAITHEPLFSGATVEAVRAAALTDARRPCPRDLPASIRQILRTATAPHAADRYASAAEFADDLSRFRHGRAIRAGRPGPVRRVWRFCRANPRAAGVLLAMLGVSSWLAFLLLGLRDSAVASEVRAARFELQRLADSSRELDPPWPDNTARIADWISRADAALQSMPRALALDGLATELQRRIEQRRADLAWSREGARRLRTDAELWQRATQTIRELEAYRGREVDLPPQVGLVPIGVNEQGLYEFYHLRSCDLTAPQGVSDYSSADRPPGLGIVFVLVPGYRDAAGAWQPPFFLSKYETTYLQLHRLMPEARRTQSVRPGDTSVGSQITAEHPAVTVDWLTCQAAADEFGLRLPSATEWLHAFRAGSETSWPTGANEASLEGHGNLADQGVDADKRGDWTLVAWSDGYQGTAPVGQFRPNGFGLHDMIGNVAEWTATGTELPRCRIICGCAFDSDAGPARTTMPTDSTPDTLRDYTIGFRFARTVLPGR